MRDNLCEEFVVGYQCFPFPFLKTIESLTLPPPPGLDVLLYIKQ